MSTHLPRCCVSPEVSEHSRKPVVDLIEGQLPVGGLEYGLGVTAGRERSSVNRGDRTDGQTGRQTGRQADRLTDRQIGTYMAYERGVGKRGPDIGVLVELTVLSQLCGTHSALMISDQ